MIEYDGAESELGLQERNDSDLGDEAPHVSIWNFACWLATVDGEVFYLNAQTKWGGMKTT
jgi:hypothetical protein